jgi:predicted transcriptional regulator
MTAKSRIYAVADGATVALVRAVSPSQAIAHITRARYSVRVASQDDIVSAITAGSAVADATRDDPNTQPIPE